MLQEPAAGFGSRNASLAKQPSCFRLMAHAAEEQQTGGAGMPRHDKTAPPGVRTPGMPSGTAKPLVAGLGPHGERPATPDLIVLSPEMVEQARASAFRVAILLHTTVSDWAQRQIAGIDAGLRQAGAIVVEIVDCAYDPARQVAAIERLIRSKLDAVISIPVGSTTVADAFRKISAAGIKLVLLDNAPSGLLAEIDYVSVVSSDNFGLGQIAARLLSPHVPRHGSVCVIAYNIDFFATAQREIAFNKWMHQERPDVALSHLKFDTPDHAGEVIGPLLDRHPDLDGLFVVWDEPAVASLQMMESHGKKPAMTTVDLGHAIAEALKDGRIVKGVAAQRPFEQGLIAATVAIVALTGNAVPPWIVLPGLAVTAVNVAEAYKDVGGAPASSELMAFRGSS
jgi:ribose transport system substrate-binding protein